MLLVKLILVAFVGLGKADLTGVGRLYASEAGFREEDSRLSWWQTNVDSSNADEFAQFVRFDSEPREAMREEISEVPSLDADATLYGAEPEVTVQEWSHAANLLATRVAMAAASQDVAPPLGSAALRTRAEQLPRTFLQCLGGLQLTYSTGGAGARLGVRLRSTVADTFRAPAADGCADVSVSCGSMVSTAQGSEFSANGDALQVPVSFEVRGGCSAASTRVHGHVRLERAGHAVALRYQGAGGRVDGAPMQVVEGAALGAAADAAFRVYGQELLSFQALAAEWRVLQDGTPAWFKGGGEVTLARDGVAADAPAWVACFAHLRVDYEGGWDGEASVALRSLVHGLPAFKQRVKCFTEISQEGEPLYKTRDVTFTCADLHSSYGAHGPVVYEEKGVRVLPNLAAFTFSPLCETTPDPMFEVNPYAINVALKKHDQTLTLLLTDVYGRKLYVNNKAVQLTTGNILGLAAAAPATRAVVEAVRLPAGPAWVKCLKTLEVEITRGAAGRVRGARLKSDVHASFSRSAKCKTLSRSGQTSFVTTSVRSSCSGLALYGAASGVLAGGTKIVVPLHFATAAACDRKGLPASQDPLVTQLVIEKRNGVLVMSVGGTKVKGIRVKVRKGALLGVKK